MSFAHQLNAESHSAYSSSGFALPTEELYLSSGRLGADWAQTMHHQRFSTLEDEHKVALHMLQCACAHLQELMQENRTLHSQNHHLKEVLTRQQGWQGLQSEFQENTPAFVQGMASSFSQSSSCSFSSRVSEAGLAETLRTAQDVMLMERFAKEAQKKHESLQASRALQTWREPSMSSRSTGVSEHLPVTTGMSTEGSRSVSKGASEVLREERPQDSEVPQTSLADPTFVGLQHQLQNLTLQHQELRVSQEQSSEQAAGEQDVPGASRKAFEPWMTTIVVRNIPARYTQERLLEVWKPNGSYNFLYLPYSVRQKRGAGYVFINFCTHDAAMAFWQAVQGSRLPGCEHLKSLDIAVADVQGLDENLRYWRNRKLGRINNANFLPIVLNGTQRLDFRQHVSCSSGECGEWTPLGVDEDEDLEPHSVKL